METISAVLCYDSKRLQSSLDNLSFHFSVSLRPALFNVAEEECIIFRHKNIQILLWGMVFLWIEQVSIYIHLH